MRRLISCLASALAATLLLTSAATAKCSGISILPKLTKSHPEIMAEVRDAASKIQNTNAILWRVEKAGLKPSHLFGTIHVSDPRILAIPTAALDAIKEAKIVALEIADMSPAAMMQAVSKVPQLMVYTDGSRLDQKLTEDDFKKVTGVLNKAGMPGQMAALIRPWLVSIMLAVPPCETQRAASGKPVLDPYIGSLAKAQKTPVVGLETVEAQLKSMAGIADDDQIAMLRSSLAFLDQRDDIFETLLQSYINRDLGMVLSLTQGMAKIAGLKESGFANFSRELIENRNHKMLDSSLPMIDQGGAFIAVGAAHLIGDTGLVALIRKAGFSVTAVN